MPARAAIASVEVPCRPATAKSAIAASRISSRRSAALIRLRTSAGIIARKLVTTHYHVKRRTSGRERLFPLAPQLDGYLLDRQRNRRLRLGRLDPHALGSELRDQAVGQRRAQALERAVGALLGGQRDRLADLGVVDGVLDAVGDDRVAGSDLEAQVDHQSLADLAFGLRDPEVGVQRQAGDLNGDVGVATADLVELVGP